MLQISHICLPKQSSPAPHLGFAMIQSDWLTPRNLCRQLKSTLFPALDSAWAGRIYCRTSGTWSLSLVLQRRQVGEDCFPLRTGSNPGLSCSNHNHNFWTYVVSILGKLWHFFPLTFFFFNIVAAFESDEFMTFKKSHEVQSMSEVVACLAQHCGVNQVGQHFYRYRQYPKGI